MIVGAVVGAFSFFKKLDGNDFFDWYDELLLCKLLLEKAYLMFLGQLWIDE